MAGTRNRRMIDVHAHILPGVDDGARTMEEACELVRQAHEAGFRAIIATPHYSRRRGSEGFELLAQQLQEQVKKFAPDFFIYLGQETYYHEELTERLRVGKALTLAKSRYVLIEFDPDASYQVLERAVRQLLTAGYIPVLAHIERYRCLRDKKRMELLSRSECLMQMNYESLDGFFLSPEVRWCRKQVKEGRIHLLGTDMHRTDHRRPEVSGAMRWLIRHVPGRQVRAITRQNALRILNNEEIG